MWEPKSTYSPLFYQAFGPFTDFLDPRYPLKRSNRPKILADFTPIWTTSRQKSRRQVFPQGCQISCAQSTNETPYHELAGLFCKRWSSITQIMVQKH